MKIVGYHPPNFAAIAAVFPCARTQRGVLFAYGDTVYNPDNVMVDQYLQAHEQVHLDQQAGLPAEWWKLYLECIPFRLNQEVEAHRAEWKAFREDPARNRNERRVYLRTISERLSSPLYRFGITTTTAKFLIAGKENDVSRPLRVAPTGWSAWVDHC